jgi:hypothetical protein
VFYDHKGLVVFEESVERGYQELDHSLEHDEAGGASAVEEGAVSPCNPGTGKNLCK